MDAIELSDLEEGEILEYEFCSPDSANDEEILGNRKSTSQKAQSEFGEKMFHTVHIKNNIFSFSKHREQRDLNKISKEKLKFKEKNRLSVDKNKYELDSISSSEEEYRLIEDKNVNMYNYGKKSEGKLKKCHSEHGTYGMVEDIMSEIGEMICRKSCNYRRQRSRDIACNYNIINGPNNRVLPNHFSNMKKKYGKRKKSNSDSDSEIFQRDLKEDLSRNKKEKKKKKKKRKNFYCHEHESGYRSEEKPLSKKLRDFDEVRRNLLEKLKEKQKAEEELRKKGENSESRVIEISTDGTNSAKNLSNGEAGDKEKGTGMESEGSVIENQEDEDLDLIKLRSMALASNRRRRNGESLENYSPETGTCSNNMNKCSSAESKSDLSRNDEDGDLDRNELLLRAEALKTALLKKHQRRLNKLRKEKLNPGGSCSDNDSPSPRTLPVGKKTKDAGECNGDGFGSKLDVNACKENLGEEKRSESNPSCSKVSEGRSITEEAAVLPCDNPKKMNLKARNRKKKKKRNLLLNSVKENDVTETVEEDDRTLRSQLLCDLFRKKSLKDLEKKSVLIDSVQTSANRFSVISSRKPEVKSVHFVQNNVLKKVNTNKTNIGTGAAVVAKPEIQRIIVHLGQEDSSEDDSELHLKQEEEEEEGEEERGVSFADWRTVSKEVDESIQASYEKSVELLLSQARKKIEGEKQRAEDDHLATPEAVYKHLPPSQRLEYMRLKQKIAERERLRQSKNIVPSGSSSGPAKRIPPTPENVAGTDSAPARENGAAPPAEASALLKNNLLKKGLVKTSFQGKGRRAALPSRVTNLVRTPVNGKPKNSLIVNRVKVNQGGAAGRAIAVSASDKASQGNGVLAPSNLALISKLKLLLKKIKMEKTIEENYGKEIGKLKNQLSFFEKKKNEQRFKIKKLAEESMKIYGVVQSAAKKKGMQEPGNGSGEAKERTGAQVENTQETEPEPQTDIKVENGSAKEGIESKISESATPSTVELVEYNSPLQVFQKACVRSKKVDPNVIMCQFDLMGVCKDEECAYQHLRPS